MNLGSECLEIGQWYNSNPNLTVYVKSLFRRIDNDSLGFQIEI